MEKSKTAKVTNLPVQRGPPEKAVKLGLRIPPVSYLTGSANLLPAKREACPFANGNIS